MWSVMRDYHRARAYRRRKAILYSTYTGVITLILGGSIFHIGFLTATIWILTRWRYTLNVERCNKIHNPEVRNG